MSTSTIVSPMEDDNALPKQLGIKRKSLSDVFKCISMDLPMDSLTSPVIERKDIVFDDNSLKQADNGNTVTRVGDTDIGHHNTCILSCRRALRSTEYLAYH